MRDFLEKAIAAVACKVSSKLMKIRSIIIVLVGVSVIGGGIIYFMYRVMGSSHSYYYSVDDFAADRGKTQNYTLRIGGKVKSGSVERDPNRMNLAFILAGVTSEMPVQYAGPVPDSFAGDRDVVIEGCLDTTGIFQANLLMSRCESKQKSKGN
jgi:cytochrome c-type biogenesis protein CcmE